MAPRRLRSGGLDKIIMEKRAFLAIALSLLVLVLYQEWISRQYPTPPPQPPPEQKKEAAKAPAADSVTAPAPTEIKPVPTSAGGAIQDVRAGSLTCASALVDCYRESPRNAHPDAQNPSVSFPQRSGKTNNSRFPYFSLSRNTQTVSTIGCTS